MLLSFALLIMLNLISEVYYYDKFKIEILNIVDCTELVASRKVLTGLEQLSFIFFLPVLICIIFIVHIWKWDTSSKEFCRRLSLIFGLAPLCLFLLKLLKESNRDILCWMCIIFILTIILWIMIFHIRKFEVTYFTIHIFLVCTVILFFITLTRLDYLIRKQAGSAPKLIWISPLIAKNLILVGRSKKCIFYYNQVENSSVIVGISGGDN